MESIIFDCVGKHNFFKMMTEPAKLKKNFFENQETWKLMNCHIGSSGLTRTRERLPQSHIKLCVEKGGSALMLYRLEEVKLICDCYK